MHDLDRTIIAIATPPGRGGIGAIRISGPEAVSIAARLFRPRHEDRRLPAGVPRFGRFVGADGHAVDHGYLVLFGADRAYTGEPTAELWTHGSPAVQRALVDAAIAQGAEAAGPGEFTYRALRHGRLDLARAEAVRDLVAARTVWQARVALSQAEGALSRRLAPVREALADLMARAEASIEFVDDHETGLDADLVARRIDEVRRSLAVLLQGFRAARLLREGAVVAITGMPNVGKSSLFNRLLERDRAIVAVTPGTTRDTLEEEIDLEGMPVRLVDTAGIRDAEEPVEGEGVRRARAAAASADIVILVLDATRRPLPIETEALRAAAAGEGRPPTIVVRNKADLRSSESGPIGDGTLLLSALTGEGVPALRKAIRNAVVGAEMPDDPVLTDARHAVALRDADRSLEAALAAGREGLGEDAVLEDLRHAMRHVGEVTGVFDAEQLYDRVFATFCIGK